MEQIMEKDINFSTLQRLNVLASESKIYHDDEQLYKIFHKITKDELLVKKLKVELLQYISIPNVLEPKKSIYSKNILGKENFIGYAREYKNGEVLFDYFSKSSDISMFLQIMKEISQTLKVIHNDHIIVGDLQFDNILIDEKLNHYFLDIDSCIIDRIPTVTYPAILHYYARNRCISRPLNEILSEKTDRLCLLMNFLSMLFGHDPDYISPYEYDKKAEQIKTLKNIREIVTDITDKDIFLPDVPYIDELICEEDIKRKIILQ